jgi:hypothetical protein
MLQSTERLQKTSERLQLGKQQLAETEVRLGTSGPGRALAGRVLQSCSRAALCPTSQHCCLCVKFKFGAVILTAYAVHRGIVVVAL